MVASMNFMNDQRFGHPNYGIAVTVYQHQSTEMQRYHIVAKKTTVRTDQHPPTVDILFHNHTLTSNSVSSPNLSTFYCKALTLTESGSLRTRAPRLQD
jgi:hypothetical protein